MGSNCCKGDAAGRPLRANSSIYSRYIWLAIIFVQQMLDVPWVLRYPASRAGASLDDRFTTSDDAGGVRLTVSAARTGDSGVYTLQASNAAGSDTTRVRLEVCPDEAPTGDDPPTFLRRLQDLTVKVGTRTRFLVEIVSSTECKVTWFRNERRLMEAERVSLARDGNFWCADLATVSVDDAGRWTCTAENLGGRASCSAHLNVLVPKAYKRPEFVEELRALLTEQGTVSLECKVVGVPTPVLRWFKDSREIKAGDVFALTANAEDPTSLGTYTCEAVNCMGRAYSSSKVHVVGRASREGSSRPTSSGVALEPPPIFTKELEDQFVRICEPLTLGCHIVVPPWPRSVVWYNKDGKVDPNERYHVIEDGVGGYLIEVTSAEWPDEGEWKCVATSSGGRVGISTCYVSMDLPKNYRKPRFMENLQAVLTEEGLVSFECKVVGFPTPVLSWFKDGQELKPGDVYQLTGTNSLGSYCCIAKNCMGQASSSAELTVEDIQNQLNEEEKSQLFSKNQAPKFIQGLKSVEAKIDEPFRFTIKVAIPPEPSVLWYRDDQPVDESQRCHLGREERGVFNLDIQNLEFLDQSEWKCVAMNDYGHSVTSCFLKLIIPRHYKKPRFLENLQAILSDEGAVNLECKVIGVPQPVLKWYKDGEELKPGDIHRIISGQDGTCCLGTYTCEAQNCMGIAASSASLLGFDDSMKAKKKKAEEQALQRNLSLSTIHEERTSQMYDTPVGDITLDDKGEISFSFDGKEVSVSLYETPDLTEEEALQIVEMYADQLSENVTEHNVVELPPLRFVKETSTSGNLLMEAIIIDVSPEYFASPDEDLRTEADIEDISIADENAPPQLSLDQEIDIGGEDYLEKTMALLSEEKADIPLKLSRKKSDSQRSADDFYSLSRDQSLSEEKKDDDTQAITESDLPSFASAHSMGKPKSKSLKPSAEEGQESSEPTKTILLKEETANVFAEPEGVIVKSKRERRRSRSSRRSSSGSEKSLSKPKEESKPTKLEVNEVFVKPAMSGDVFRSKMVNVSSTLSKVINDVQIIERDIILKSELMSSAATASRSLEIISSLVAPLSEIHSIADAAKESDTESKEVSSTLFNSLPHPLRTLQQSLTIIEKCIDVECENKTLVRKTCVAFIEKCGIEMQNLMSEIRTVIKNNYLLTNENILSEIDNLTKEVITVVKFSEETVKAKNLLNEASEIKIDEPSFEVKHAVDTQKALFELKGPLNSLLCIVESADSSKTAVLSKVKISDVILNDMSASIQDLQTALEQIESLSVKETTSSLQKYNTQVIETVMESILKLRGSFEQLSTESKTEEDTTVLKETLNSIKSNLNEISSHINSIESSVGTFDILQSEHKLEALQKMAQILIALENNLPRLETMPEVKSHIDIFHKNLTKVLENVIESNDAKKYFTLLEICNAVNRINTSIRNVDSDSILSLASLSNALSNIQEQFVKNIFESELNCCILSNIADVQVGIQEAINNAEELSIHIDSEHIQDISPQVHEITKANIIVEHINQTIAAINTVKSIETTQEIKPALAPALENICPALEELKRSLASFRNGVEQEEHISEFSDVSFVETIATPLCELNENIIILNQMIVENIESIKDNTDIILTVAEPLQELHTTLEILQQDVISQYREDIIPYAVSFNIANAVDNLQSCIVMIQEQAALEGAEEISTLDDISGIKTTADTIPSDRLILPAVEETLIEQSLASIKQELLPSATVQALQLLNEHITVLQKPEVLDALDTLSEVSDYSSLKSITLNLGELHTEIQEIIHPVVMEDSNDLKLLNISKLSAIAEPLQELQESLSVLDINNIPIYESILELPAEETHSVFRDISLFKEHLQKCIHAISQALNTAENTIDISNNVGSLREVSIQLKDLIESAKGSPLGKLAPENVLEIEETINNLLNATDVCKGIKVDQVKCIIEELFKKIVDVQEEIIHFTPHSPEKLIQEAKLIRTIDGVESCIAILEQYDFVDLSRTSDITVCPSPQLAVEIESKSLIQMEDIVTHAVNVVQDLSQNSPDTEIKIVENFFKTCKCEFTIIRYLLSKQMSHKKIIRLLQEFCFLQNTINDFKLKRSEHNLSHDINECLETFLIHADESLGSLQTSLIKIVETQSELLFTTPMAKLDYANELLQEIIVTKKDDNLEEIIKRFVNIIEIAKPCVINAQSRIISELKNSYETQTKDAEKFVIDRMNEFTVYVKEQLNIKYVDDETNNVLIKVLECIDKHQDFKDAVGSGKILILLKCLSSCSDILQETVHIAKDNETLSPKHEDSILKSVLIEMLEPLHILHSQLINVQEQILSGVEDNSISLDITSTESVVQTMSEIHKEIVQQITTDKSPIDNEAISLIMEVDKEIHSIQDSMRSIDNAEFAQKVKEIAKPIEDIEKSLHIIIASEKETESKDKLPKDINSNIDSLENALERFINIDIDLLITLSSLSDIDVNESIQIAVELKSLLALSPEELLLPKIVDMKNEKIEFLKRNLSKFDWLNTDIHLEGKTPLEVENYKRLFLTTYQLLAELDQVGTLANVIKQEEKAAQLMDHIDQYIELIEIVEEISATIKIDDLKETIDTARELRESISASDTALSQTICDEVQSQQACLAQKLQKAIFVLQVQVMDSAPELASTLSPDVLQRIVRVTAQLQADLVAVTGVNVAVQAPLEIDVSEETTMKVEVSDKYSAELITLEMKNVAECFENTAIEQPSPIDFETNIAETLESIIPDVLDTENINNESISERVSITTTEILNEAVTSEDNIVFADKTEEIAPKNTLIEELKPPTQENQKELRTDDNIEQDAHKKNTDVIVQHIKELISNDIMIAVDELSSVTNVDLLKQSVSAAKELLESIAAFETITEIMDGDDLKLVKLQEQAKLVQQLQTSLSELDVISLESIVNIKPTITQEAIQNFAKITENLRTDLASLSTSDILTPVVTELTVVEPSYETETPTTIEQADIDEPQIVIGENVQIMEIEGEKLENVQLAVTDNLLIDNERVESLETVTDSMKVSVASSGAVDVTMDTDSGANKENENIVLTQGAGPILQEVITIDEIAIHKNEEQAIEKVQEPLIEAKIETVIQNIDEYLSDNVIQIINELDLVINVDELKRSISLAKEFRESIMASEVTMITEALSVQQTEALQEQAHIAQQLQNALSALQIQVLDQASKMDTIIDKDKLFQVADVASQLSVRLEAAVCNVTIALQSSNAEEERYEVLPPVPVNETLNETIVTENMASVPAPEKSESTIMIQEEAESLQKLEISDVEQSQTEELGMTEDNVTSSQNETNDLVKQGPSSEEVVNTASESLAILVPSEKDSTPTEKIAEASDVFISSTDTGSEGIKAPASSEEEIQNKENVQQSGFETLLQNINEYLSKNIIQVVNELPTVFNIDEHKKSVTVAKKLQESITAQKTENCTVGPEIGSNNRNVSCLLEQMNLVHQLQNALSVTQVTALDTAGANTALLDRNKVQLVANIVARLSAELDVIIASELVVQQALSMDIKESEETKDDNLNVTRLEKIGIEKLIQPLEIIETEPNIQLLDIKTVTSEQQPVTSDSNIKDNKLLDDIIAVERSILQSHIIDATDTAPLKPTEVVDNQNKPTEQVVSCECDIPTTITFAEFRCDAAIPEKNDSKLMRDDVIGDISFELLPDSILSDDKVSEELVTAPISENTLEVDLLPTEFPSVQVTPQVETENAALIQHIDQLISDEILELVKEVSAITNTDIIKESVEIARELRECIAAVELNVMKDESSCLFNETLVEQTRLAIKLQEALSTFQTVSFDSVIQLEPIIKPDVMHRLNEIVTHLQEDLEHVIMPTTPEVVKDLSSACSKSIMDIAEEISIQHLEALLLEVSDTIDSSSTDIATDDTDLLKDRLDEVQTVIIKLKRDYDGSINDTLNETLEDLECSVRSVQLQINEDSPPELLKEACATLLLLVNNMKTMQDITVSLTVSKTEETKKLIETCSKEADETIQILDTVSNIETKDYKNLDTIIANLNFLKDTLKYLKTSFLSDTEILIEKGIDVIQNLNQMEDKVFSLEKDLDAEVNLKIDVRDNIVTAVHAIYSSISNMRCTLSRLQKQYMFENYGKPSEYFLCSIKNITAISNIDVEVNKNKWKMISQAIRKTLNHFEDIKFYVNLDKTARLPSDAAFTKIILEELKSNISNVMLPMTVSLDPEVNKLILETMQSVGSILNNIEPKSTLAVKEKIPMFIEISSKLLTITNMIKIHIQNKQDKTDLLIMEAIKQEESLATPIDIEDCSNDTLSQIVENKTQQESPLEGSESDELKEGLESQEKNQKDVSTTRDDIQNKGQILEEQKALISERSDVHIEVKTEQVSSEIVEEIATETLDQHMIIEETVSLQQELNKLEAVSQSVEKLMLDIANVQGIPNETIVSSAIGESDRERNQNNEDIMNAGPSKIEESQKLQELELEHEKLNVNLVNKIDILEDKSEHNENKKQAKILEEVNIENESKKCIEAVDAQIEIEKDFAENLKTGKSSEKTTVEQQIELNTHETENSKDKIDEIDTTFLKEEYTPKENKDQTSSSEEKLNLAQNSSTNIIGNESKVAIVHEDQVAKEKETEIIQLETTEDECLTKLKKDQDQSLLDSDSKLKVEEEHTESAEKIQTGDDRKKEEETEVEIVSLEKKTNVKEKAIEGNSANEKEELELIGLEKDLVVHENTDTKHEEINKEAYTATENDDQILFDDTERLLEEERVTCTGSEFQIKLTGETQTTEELKTECIKENLEVLKDGQQKDTDKADLNLNKEDLITKSRTEDVDDAETKQNQERIQTKKSEMNLLGEGHQFQEQHIAKDKSDAESKAHEQEVDMAKEEENERTQLEIEQKLEQKGLLDEKVDPEQRQIAEEARIAEELENERIKKIKDAHHSDMEEANLKMQQENDNLKTDAGDVDPSSSKQEDKKRVKKGKLKSAEKQDAEIKQMEKDDRKRLEEEHKLHDELLAKDKADAELKAKQEQEARKAKEEENERTRLENEQKLEEKRLLDEKAEAEQRRIAEEARIAEEIENERLKKIKDAHEKDTEEANLKMQQENDNLKTDAGNVDPSSPKQKDKKRVKKDNVKSEEKKDAEVKQREEDDRKRLEEEHKLHEELLAEDKADAELKAKQEQEARKAKKEENERTQLENEQKLEEKRLLDEKAEAEQRRIAEEARIAEEIENERLKNIKDAHQKDTEEANLKMQQEKDNLKTDAGDMDPSSSKQEDKKRVKKGKVKSEEKKDAEVKQREDDRKRLEEEHKLHEELLAKDKADAELKAKQEQEARKAKEEENERTRLEYEQKLEEKRLLDEKAEAEQRRIAEEARIAEEIENERLKKIKDAHEKDTEEANLKMQQENDNLKTDAGNVDPSSPKQKDKKRVKKDNVKSEEKKDAEVKQREEDDRKRLEEEHKLHEELIAKDKADAELKAKQEQEARKAKEEENERTRLEYEQKLEEKRLLDEKAEAEQRRIAEEARIAEEIENERLKKIKDAHQKDTEEANLKMQQEKDNLKTDAGDMDPSSSKQEDKKRVKKGKVKSEEKQDAEIKQMEEDDRKRLEEEHKLHEELLAEDKADAELKAKQEQEARKAKKEENERTQLENEQKLEEKRLLDEKAEAEQRRIAEEARIAEEIENERLKNIKDAHQKDTEEANLKMQQEKDNLKTDAGDMDPSSSKQEDKKRVKKGKVKSEEKKDAEVKQREDDRKRLEEEHKLHEELLAKDKADAELKAKQEQEARKAKEEENERTRLEYEQKLEEKRLLDEKAEAEQRRIAEEARIAEEIENERLKKIKDAHQKDTEEANLKMQQENDNLKTDAGNVDPSSPKQKDKKRVKKDKVKSEEKKDAEIKQREEDERIRLEEEQKIHEQLLAKDKADAELKAKQEQEARKAKDEENERNRLENEQKLEEKRLLDEKAEAEQRRIAEEARIAEEIENERLKKVKDAHQMDTEEANLKMQQENDNLKTDAGVVDPSSPKQEDKRVKKDKVKSKAKKDAEIKQREEDERIRLEEEHKLHEQLLAKDKADAELKAKQEQEARKAKDEENERNRLENEQKLEEKRLLDEKAEAEQRRISEEARIAEEIENERLKKVKDAHQMDTEEANLKMQQENDNLKTDAGDVDPSSSKQEDKRRIKKGKVKSEEKKDAGIKQKKEDESIRVEEEHKLEDHLLAKDKSLPKVKGVEKKGADNINNDDFSIKEKNEITSNENKRQQTEHKILKGEQSKIVKEIDLPEDSEISQDAVKKYMEDSLLDKISYRANGDINNSSFKSKHYVKEYQYEPTGQCKQDGKERPRFVDHSHRDYTIEFARPSGYREKSFEPEKLSEKDYLGKNATIYKAHTIVLDSQLRSSAPPYPDISRISEPFERRPDIRHRSKALSEARSVMSDRRGLSRDIRRKPVFSTYLTDRTAVEGSRVKLTCSVLSSADPTITWYRNGVLLDDKLKYRTKFIDGLITLEVLNTIPSDSAEYSCTVQNENGSASTSANLKVYPSFEASPIPPTFTRSIRDSYHLAENELVLECRIRGQPLPTITWLKDDKLVNSERYHAYYLADGVCRLSISKPTPEDSGKYTCKAENSVWSDQITHVVNYTGKESRLSPNLTTIEKSRFNRQAMESRRPHFTNVLSDYKVTRGGTIGLQVEIRGAPTRVEWLREGRSVTDSYRNARTFVEQELYTLALTDVTEKESGMYTCRAWSTHGNVDMNAAITVVPPNEMEGKPAIIVGRPEKDILISVGEDVNISFRVQGEPKPKVIFMKGIRDITNSQRVCKMTSDDYVKFTLKRSGVADAGTYCILARNAYGCDRAFVTVVVRQRVSSDNLISDWTYPMDDSALSITERKYKSVPERIPGEPSVVDGGNNWVSLAWPKPDPGDTAPVLAYKVESWLLGKEGGARWTELGITPLNSFDAFNLKQGEEYHFRVTPRNRYGWGESVQSSSPIGVGLAGDRPEFLEILPGQLKVLAGETANLSCSVKGKPVPEIVWMKNGHEIEEESRVKTTFNGFNCCLMIDDINIEDEARYSCEATNAHGRASTYARLAVVTDRHIWEADAKLKRERSSDGAGEFPPQFTMRLRDRRVQATYPVRLTCQVVGNPHPTIIWFKDGQEITADNRRNQSQDELFHTLEIAPTTLEDGGVYEAMARNTSGAVSCRCSLVVDKGIRAYVAPEFCCGLEPLYRLAEGDELRISAVVEAYPSVGVTWYRDGVRLRPSRRAIMTLDRDGQIELALAALTGRDAGVYTCTASNEVGRATTSGKVEVIEGAKSREKIKTPPVVISPDVPYSKEPMFIRKPRSSEAREGDTVIIECEVVGDPKPDVYWLRDFLKPDYYRDATHFKRVGAGPEYRFEIPHAKLDYTGAYSVVARNVHGEAKAIISLQILAKDPRSSDDSHNISYGRVEVIPRFERELTDLLSYDGDAVEFECRVSGSPEPDVRWFHYNEIVRDCPDFETTFDEGTARLKVKQVTADDEGTYSCEAYNSLGKARSSACLVVYPPGEPNTLSQRLRRPPALFSAASTPRSTPRSTPARSVSRTPGPDTRRLCSPTRSMAPSFYTYPFNKVVEEGDPVVFQCAVKGLPAPWTTWDKDGVIITPSARITIREKDEILRILEIDQVTVEDVGIYRITLENDFGRSEACARLEVITQKGKFYGGVRAYSASPRRSLPYRRRLPSTSRQD